jgi:hypothetical protein
VTPPGWINPSGQVIPAEDVRAAVAGTYGATMMTVQAFEFSLAVLVGVIELPDRVEAAEGQSFEEQMRAAIKRGIDITQKLTAGQARRRLEGRIDEDLLSEIEPLIAWRNFLAHRYLRVRFAGSGDGTPAMFAELIDLSRHFQAATQKVTALHQRLLDERPKTNAPAPVRAAFTGMVRQMALQEPAPLPRQRGKTNQSGAA